MGKVQESAGQSVLVIDDDPHVVIAIRMCLEEKGFSVETAKDGVEGLEKAFAVRPSLILLDLKMPKMSGHLVLRALKEDPRTAFIPVVVLTGLSENDEKDRAYKEGAAECLIKPFGPRELEETVLRFLPIVKGGKEHE